jgi:hypothetical protein
MFLIPFMFMDTVKCNAAGGTPRTYAQNKGTQGWLTLPVISLIVLLLWGSALPPALFQTSFTLPFCWRTSLSRPLDFVLFIFNNAGSEDNAAGDRLEMHVPKKGTESILFTILLYVVVKKTSNRPVLLFELVA